ncbi:MAG: PhnD/SsuA/transferrin family substrate-binding protein, partial [Acidobacteria bacterium]|nr:PhnD/SsuA/transferrin family substrate-binding protein [Candidatus Sulfomarinibacter sp. MAG AM2]
AAVIQALGAGQADVAWIPAFAYVLANARFGAEARLQVVRSVDRFSILVTRVGPGEPDRPEDLAGRRVAFPADLAGPLRADLVQLLDERAPGWIEVAVASDVEAVFRLVENRDVEAAASRQVYSAPRDLVGDGRKEMEYRRPGTLRETRIVHTSEQPKPELSNVYYGCVMARSDSGVNRLEDLNGQSFAFSDETSTSGHIFARALLNRSGVTLGHTFFAGGHPNVVQAVRDGKVAGGATFYSPPSAANRKDGTLVGDARFLVLKNMATAEERAKLLDEVRIIALTDPIPNDVCCVRRGFSKSVWERFERSMERFLETPDGRSAYYDLVAGVAAEKCTDADFDEFRTALTEAGVSASRLLEAAEEKNVGVMGVCTDPLLPPYRFFPVTTYVSQEIPLMTGAVDLIVAGSQFVNPSLAEVARDWKVTVVPTDGLTQNADPDAFAQKIVEQAVQAFEMRQNITRDIPMVKESAVMGYSA